MFKFSKEILHRAISQEYHEWVYGWAFGPDLGAIIDIKSERLEQGVLMYQTYPILLGSVCRFSGFQDKKGEKIFEKDVLFNPVFGDYWVCELDHGCWLVHLIGDNYRTLLCDVEEFEIVGNLHDDPEYDKE